MTSRIKLEAQNHPRDAAFAKSLHGLDAEQRAGLRAMLTKDTSTMIIVINDYFKHWEWPR